MKEQQLERRPTFAILEISGLRKLLVRSRQKFNTAGATFRVLVFYTYGRRQNFLENCSSDVSDHLLAGCLFYFQHRRLCQRHLGHGTATAASPGAQRFSLGPVSGALRHFRICAAETTLEGDGAALRRTSGADQWTGRAASRSASDRRRHGSAAKQAVI